MSLGRLDFLVLVGESRSCFRETINQKLWTEIKAVEDIKNWEEYSLHLQFLCYAYGLWIFCDNVLHDPEILPSFEWRRKDVANSFLMQCSLPYVYLFAANFEQSSVLLSSVLLSS